MSHDRTQSWMFLPVSLTSPNLSFVSDSYPYGFRYVRTCRTRCNIGGDTNAILRVEMRRITGNDEDKSRTCGNLKGQMRPISAHRALMARASHSNAR